MTRALSIHLALLVALGLAGGCSATHIPNTTVEDNAANRDVINFVEEYRRAVEGRNVQRLLALASDRYFDDGGTPTGDDDIDHDGLRTHLAAWGDALIDCRYEIRYRDVEYRQDQRIYVSYRYTGSFRVTDVDGEERWQRRVGDNRLVLVREDSVDGFRILSGM